MPFNILFSSGDPVVIHPGKLLCRKYAHILPFAEACLTAVDGAELFSQSFAGVDFFICLLRFYSRKGIQVQLQLTRPLLVQLILLKGNLVGNAGALSLRQGQYGLFFLLPGSAALELERGVTVLLWLEPPTADLSGMAMETASIGQLFNSLHSDQAGLLASPIFRFPDALLRLLQRLENCPETGAALELVLHSCLLQLLFLYYRQVREQLHHPSYRTTEEVAVALQRYILANLANPGLGRVKELTGQFHITATTLRRAFKKLCGRTVPQFIREERLALAHRLLTEGRSVQETAMAIGYEWDAHFSREFRRQYGYSPGFLKKQRRKSAPPNVT